MKFRKLFSIALSLAMLMSAHSVFSISSENSMPFCDVESGKWYYKNIEFVYGNGYMKGISETIFSPDSSLSRAMFVTVLGRMAGVNDSIPDSFPDTQKDSWYSDYVGWAVEKGIIEGFPDGTFGPDDPMSREQMAAAMVRYIEAEDINLPRGNDVPYVFNDSEDISVWAEEFIEVLRRSGIVCGDQNKNFQPKKNISRAETAAIIKNLAEAEYKAWQGYTPDSKEDGYAVFGAKYLYWSGTIVQGTLGTEISNSDSLLYPALTAFNKKDVIVPLETLDPDGTVGISSNVAEIDLAETPVIKICYSYEGFDKPDYLTGIFNVNKKDVSEPINFIPGLDDEEWATATANLTDLLSAHSDIEQDIDFSHILFKPFEDGYSGDGKFMIRYIGFFNDQASADKFVSADQQDYLKNYFVHTDVKYLEFTKDEEDKYDKLLSDRINELVNAESAVTPDDIKTSGGKAYFVSSINGDDNNDGLSEKTPWKSLENLFYIRLGVRLSKLKAGDGVFFERGSEFYAKQYNQSSVTCLDVKSGITYGAYGKGDKPLFSCAIDFTDSNGVGRWIKTKYKNIWALDEIDPNPDFCGNKSEIGNMVFNEGDLTGIRIKSSNEEYPFGPDRTASAFLTIGYGGSSAYVYNGEELYLSSPTSCNNIGEALNHNLEYFHDYKEGKLYLYWDKGNPADSFYDIKASRGGYVLAGGQKNAVFDSLAIMYSGRYGMSVGGKNLHVSNCEIGYIYGCNVETGIEIFGASDGTYITDCYVHDIGGALTCQSAQSAIDETIGHIQNVEFAYNVITSSVTGAENWNHMGPVDENGYGQNKMINQWVHDNIFAYMGYSRTKITPPSANGSVVNGSIYGEMENCIFENNTILYGAGYMFYSYIATDKQPRGWQCRNNVYVGNPAHQIMQYSYETIDYINHNMNKHTRTSTPYNYRYIVYYTSHGFDPSGTFYYYNTDTEKRIINEWLLKK